jgi:hypothetical protein
LAERVEGLDVTDLLGGGVFLATARAVHPVMTA